LSLLSRATQYAAVLLVSSSLMAFAIASLTLQGPAGTGQVGVFYSSGIVASGGIAPYTYSIPVGSMPPGLNLNTSTGAITGTPQASGTFNFTGQVGDSSPCPCGLTDSRQQPTARGGVETRVAKPGAKGVSVTGSFSITVSGGAASAAPVPISPMALLLAMAGLLCVGLMSMRQLRRSA
jgi:Putative Ig domain